MAQLPDDLLYILYRVDEYRQATEAIEKLYYDNPDKYKWLVDNGYLDQLSPICFITEDAAYALAGYEPDDGGAE